jgi:hypothetical protein
MRNSVKGLPAWRLLCAAALLGLASPAYAAETGKDAPPPETRGGKDAPPPETRGGPATATMKDLVGDGFLIRTTVLVPADAVTRQSGKPSSDAIIVTLQKETAMAVCYYTLKAYVKGGLTGIPSCTVFP